MIVLLDAELWAEHVRAQPVAANAGQLFDCDAMLGWRLSGLNPARDGLRLLAQLQCKFALRLGRQAQIGDFDGFHAHS